MNSNCPRAGNFSPAAWSRVSLGDTFSLQCAICFRNGVKAHDSMYCTKQCFKADWKRHCTTHNTSSTAGQIGSFKDGTPRKGATPGKGSRGDSVGDEDGPSGAQNHPDEHWEHVGSDSTYIPTDSDVGHVLMVSVTALSQANDSVVYGPMTIYTEPVLSAPRMTQKRNMVPVQLQPGQQPVSPGTIKFRILSYNILAELYATKQSYPYADSWLLSWPYRRSLIMQELEAMQGDIVCLQEVQMDHFEMHLSPFMHDLGFDGLFKSKSRESMGQYGKVDGCATFWKLAKFSMTEHYTIEFNDLARHAISDMGLDPAEERKYINRLSKDNVAQIVVLEVIPKHGVRPPRQLSHLCVVNTHLYSNVNRPDVKLWQTMALTNELQQFAIQRDLALIVCGDFNSEPESAVHELLTEGCLTRHHPELEDEEDNVRILPDQGEIYHNLDLASAMQTALGHEPAYTNYTWDWKGTLDYMLFSPMRIRLMSVAQLPTEQEIMPESGRGLPSAVYPSDHMMLCVDVALSITGSGSVVNSNSPGGSGSNQGRGSSHGGYGRKQGVSTGLGAHKRPGMR
jgi:CCR4-NOT transcription complex subunit 6